MSSIVQKKQQQKIADDLVKKTHFSKFEIECLLKRYRELAKHKIDRGIFRDVLHNDFHITEDIILDRVFRAFDKDNDSYIIMEEWVKGMSVFLRGDLDEKIKFCFDVYDLNGDGHISREEMFTLLKSSIVKQTSDEDPDEGVRDLVELALKKMDVDCDHKVSMCDFETAVKQDSLLLQAFGSCLPDESTCNDFEATVVLA